jgi:hypothetical protein
VGDDEGYYILKAFTVGWSTGTFRTYMHTYTSTCTINCTRLD